MAFCEEHDLPALIVLVVNEETGEPNKTGLIWTDPKQFCVEREEVYATRGPRCARRSRSCGRRTATRSPWSGT